MTTDLEMQLKAKYDELESGALSYADFTTWFEQQKWPSSEETNRMFEAVELTGAHIKNSDSVPEDLSRAHLRKIGDYLHGRTDVKPAMLGQDGMSPDALRHAYEEKHRDGTY
ncbi:MAG: hypothetical protein KC438_14365 [Thermomicrobiales bacterium]|nr:hypothetical protein [Thermomicrobiales bacterium]MCO5223471.1 hypothetical protein [Thermomicrobiales bacterium]